MEVMGKLARVARANWGMSFEALRTIYSGVFEAIMTYGSASWAETALGVQRNQMQLLRAQRTSLLIVTKAYRTTSAMALPVIAGVLPIDLLATERATIYNRRLEGVGELRASREARERSLERWQHRWETCNMGRWTYEIWPDVKERMEVHWFRTNHYVTQFASGHGNFRQKLHSFGLSLSPACPLCGVDDTLQHALLVCDVTEEARHALRGDLLAAGLDLTVETVFRTAEGHDVFRRYARLLGQIREDYERELLWQLAEVGLHGD